MLLRKILLSARTAPARSAASFATQAASQVPPNVHIARSFAPRSQNPVITVTPGKVVVDGSLSAKSDALINYMPHKASEPVQDKVEAKKALLTQNPSAMYQANKGHELSSESPDFQAKYGLSNR